MIQSQFDKNNPYQSPVATTPLVPLANSDQQAAKLLHDFRTQVLTLGIFWIIIGTIAMASALLLPMALSPGNPNAARAMMVAGVFAMLWIVLGALVCMKRIWAVYTALAFSYLALIANVLSIQICTSGVLILVILQAHRVLGWARQLRAAGIPLTARPAELRIGASSPEQGEAL